MSRDDSALYSGVSSASFGSTREQQVLKDKKETSSENRARLKPHAEIVMAEIQKEIDDLKTMEIVDVKAIISNTVDPDKTLSIILFGREEARERLVSVKARLSNILRDNKR